jgi:diguanylate cyclase (GGDEF)-like protein/putative nucleotidyltransferase with HDIG domain
LARPHLLSALEALAVAIDAKDNHSVGHIPRVRLYAGALARALGMSESDVEAVDVAAMLHDIGKLAVPAPILSKSGPLTPDELQKIRAHPKVGADIISAVPFPYPVAPLVLGHHERWDGTGYPEGLKGKEIPLGARILSVVDCFDALRVDSPSAESMSFDAAGGLLQQEAGKGLDPALVEKFLEVLPSVQEEARAMEASDPARLHVGAFEEIGEAHREQSQEGSLADPLTGLPNTGFLFLYLTRELARAERLKTELGLLVIHLDDLIGINRTHGHYAGDRALCEVARVLRSAIRPYDVAVRYKGREFIVVLSGCGATELEQRRLEMKKSIDDLYFETAPGKRLKLTISSGGAIFPKDGRTYEALLGMADSRL